MPDFVAFDLDHTILDGDSDYLWGEFLVEKGAIPSEKWAEHNRRFYEQYQEGSLRIREYLRMAFGLLSNYPIAQLRQWRTEYYEEKLKPLFRPKAVALVEQSLARGDVLLLITATNSFIAQVSADHLGIDNLIASEAEISDGQFTGEFLGTPCFREGKIIRLRQWLGENNYDPERDIKKFRFYSDSHNDTFLLEQVGKPFAVNPDDRLKKTAQERGWAILDLN